MCASVVNEIARLYNNIILHAQYTYRKVILHNIIRNAVLLDEQAYSSRCGVWEGFTVYGEKEDVVVVWGSSWDV